MIKPLKNIISEYAEGVSDKTETSSLDVFIAGLKVEKPEARLTLTSALTSFVQEHGCRAPRYWAAINLLVEKLSLHNFRLAQAINMSLEANFPDEIRDRFEQLSAFIVAGGGLTPKLLNNEASLKEQAPALWLDLALKVYGVDYVGLLEAITDLLNQSGERLVWQDIRRRIPKLSLLFGTEANRLLRDIAKIVPDENGADALLQKVDKQLGTKLRSSPVIATVSQIRKNRNSKAILDTVRRGFADIVPRQSEWDDATWPMAAA